MTPPVQLPAGWQVHPSNPAYAYNAAQQVVEIAALLAQFAPAAQILPALPAANPPVDEAAWGEQDMEEAQRDYDRAAAGGYGRTTNMVWINFPKLQTVGQEVAVYARVLPPWKDSKHAYADVLQHRVYSRFLPRPSKKEAVMVDCPASAIWNQRCSICEVVKLMRSSPDTGVQNAARDLSRRGGALWQVLDLSNLARHYLQAFDAAGQPQTVIVPGVVRAGAKLHQEILRVFRHGNFCHPATGFPLALIKKKTGPEDMNCEYRVDDYRQNAAPIDPAVQSVLYNLLNLVQDCCRRRPDAEMDEIAARIAANYLAPAQQQAPVHFPMPGMPAPGALAPAYAPPGSGDWTRPQAPQQPAQAPWQAPALPPPAQPAAQAWPQQQPVHAPPAPPAAWPPAAPPVQPVPAAAPPWAPPAAPPAQAPAWQPAAPPPAQMPAPVSIQQAAALPQQTLAWQPNPAVPVAPAPPAAAPPLPPPALPGAPAMAPHAFPPPTAPGLAHMPPGGVPPVGAAPPAMPPGTVPAMDPNDPNKPPF